MQRRWASEGLAATWRLCSGAPSAPDRLSSAEQQRRARRGCTAPPPSASAERRFRFSPAAAPMGCWRNVWGGLFRETQVWGQRPRAASPYRSSIITHQHYPRLSHFGHSVQTVQLASPSLSLSISLSLSLCVCRRHGSCWMAALFQKFTMKTSVFLLALAAFACGLVQGEENAAEELQVETLVSETRVLLQCNTAEIQQL